MLKVKFKNGLNGSLNDWTPFMVIQEVGVIKRSVESENPGEAGLIAYDNVSLSFRYEPGNVVYNAFSIDLANVQLYVFEIFALKTNKEEVKVFEGIADFTSIEWDINERTIKFDVVDKIKALDLLTDTDTQRGSQIDAVSRINCSDYLTDFIKRYIPGYGVWIEIQTYHLINNNGILERGEGISHSETILQKGELFFHPGEGIGYCLVTDTELMTSMGGWITTFIKIHPVKACSLCMPLTSEDTYIVVSGNLFCENDIVYLENCNQTEFLKILNEGFGSDVSWIYNVERHYTGGVAYNWDTGNKVNYSNANLTCITNLSSPPVSTHLFYYGNSYYNQPDINIYGADQFNRNVLKAFDALKIMKAIIERTLNPLVFINRSGANEYPVSLNYYPLLHDSSPLGKHSLEALKLLADSMRCYVFIDKEGRFVIQKKLNLGLLNYGVERTFDDIRLSGAVIPRKYFWDKLIDGVEAVITSDGNVKGRAAKQIFPDIKPRNELSKEIIALNDIEFTEKSLSDYAFEIAGDYLSFYGRRHESFPITISLYDDLLEWELLDYISFNGKVCFFSSFEIDIVEREFRAELITAQGENYYKGQANVPLSVEKYNKTSNGGYGGVSTEPAYQLIGAGAARYSADDPVTIDSSVIALNYEDNLKLSADSKLDTVQNIKTTDTPQFAGIAIGGTADALYKGKFYGDIKVTGKIEVDGDLNISGSVNEVNITELNIIDKTINLNKGGSNATAIESGLRILGTSGSLIASIIYDANCNWCLNKSISIPEGFNYKINNVNVLTCDSLGSGILNSSLTKVGTITQGVWNASPLNAQFINYNNAQFQNSSNQLSSKPITTGSGNGVVISGTFNLGGTLSIDTPQDIRTSASPVFNNITLNSGTINSSSDLTINLNGTSILPNTGYAYNLGSITKKYLTLHAAELCVESLVAQNTKATIGGRVLIGEANELLFDIGPSVYFINVKYNSFAPNDIIYLESAGKVEFMKVLYLTSSGQNNYEYQVQRDYDGSGANNWYAGDSLFNTGNQGDGFIDLYSIKGIKGTFQPGPTMTGNVRNSLVYNDWSEHWAIGNLNGLYGFNSPVFGVGLGKYGNNSSFVTIDPSNGFAIKHKNSSGTEIKVIELDSSGNGYFRGNINSSAVITGGVVQTALMGKRVAIDGAENDIKFYNSVGEYISVEGYLSSGSEKRLRIGGALLGEGNLSIMGGGEFSDNLSTLMYFNASQGFKIDDITIIDQDFNATLNNILGNELNITKLKLSGEDLITLRPIASKILISDSDRKITTSTVASGELFTPAFCEIYDLSSDSTITCNGTNYVKWTNAYLGAAKGIEGSSSSDCIIISSGFSGRYEAHFNVSFTANNAGDYYWAVKVGNNPVFPSRFCVRAAGVSILTHISGGCLLELNDGDQISIGCLGPNNTVINVVYLNLRIIKNSN